MASPNWSRFGSEWNMGGFGSSLCPQSFDNFWFSRLIDGPLAHWGVWMGINTLRVGPLLCPDNVGILIFERYFLKFFRVQLFLSFFNFLSHLVLSQKYLHCFRGSSFVPTLTGQRERFQVSARSKSLRLTLPNYFKVLILVNYSQLLGYILRYRHRAGCKCTVQSSPYDRNYHSCSI